MSNLVSMLFIRQRFNFGLCGKGDDITFKGLENLDIEPLIELSKPFLKKESRKTIRAVC